MELNRFFKLLNKPEYIFRPTQILRRLSLPENPAARVKIWAPWGLPLIVWPNETIGRTLVKSGVHDLAVAETIFRLVGPGDTTVDAGANVGFMTSAMLFRVGQRGRVYSFEPHPEIYRELVGNICSWSGFVDIGPVTAFQIALSNREGKAELHIPGHFNGNRGVAFIGDGVLAGHSNGDSIEVQATTLDRSMENVPLIKMLKLDVEGHEENVLEGAAELLEQKRITHVVFEEHRDYPTPVTEYLRGFGYSLFKLDKGILGLKVSSARRDQSHRSFESPSYLATLDGEAALRQLRTPGWTSLTRRGTTRSPSKFDDRKSAGAENTNCP